MKRALRLNLLVLVIAIGLNTNSVSAADIMESGGLFLQEEELKLYLTPRRACGPLAAYMSLQFHEIDVSMDEVAANVPVNDAGTSMAQLVDFLVSRKAKVETIKIDSKGLSRLLQDNSDACAIAWLDENHWVTVIPGTPSARYFDYPAWSPVTDSEFATRYSNKSVIISRKSSAPGVFSSYILRFIPWLTALGGGILSILILKHFRHRNEEVRKIKTEAIPK
eukprot:gnl/MRDRNA2_/MRDRNA2_84917_c0_seq1.p1 gnl/MRDRNA2_/MRDRNA2_84917_c0~~gnl/MRDRNA2_/MRDRNA2_84917_c0_seq1.p1  ORF type:complete len:222 (-),score=20.23 gnl/MRDRNA2_/MRDRNA2_84917_c0_seq1:1697-2362(-)